MHLTVFVHPIDTERWPSVPPGFRWAVVHGGDPGEVSAERCLQAQWEKTPAEAELAGVNAAVVGVKVARMHGNQQADYEVVHLDYDPTMTDPMHFYQGPG